MTRPAGRLLRQSRSAGAKPDAKRRSSRRPSEIGPMAAVADGFDPRAAHDEAWNEQRRQQRAKQKMPGTRTLFWHQLQDLPDPDYIIKSVIERGALVEIYGPHGSGKSFFTCDL